MDLNRSEEAWSTEFRCYQEILSKNIKHLRMLKNLSQEKLGFHANVDRTLVSKIERCLANPTLEILIKIAFCLDVSVTELLKR
jgi:transcriptional regulator with XRE-family HTH domain